MRKLRARAHTDRKWCSWSALLCASFGQLCRYMYIRRRWSHQGKRDTDWIRSGLVSGYITQDIIMVSHKIELKWSFIMNEETHCVWAHSFSITKRVETRFGSLFQSSVPMELNSRAVCLFCSLVVFYAFYFHIHFIAILIISDAISQSFSFVRTLYCCPRVCVTCC